MSMMDKFINVVAWIISCVGAFFATSRVYLDWVMHTQVHSIFILAVFFALIFWGFFTLFSKVGIWTNKEGRE